MKSLIVFPLIMLVGVAIFSQMGVSQVSSSADTYSYGLDGYYDVDGHKVLDSNFTTVGEAGQLGHSFHPDPDLVQYYWTNVTDRYEIYNSDTGANIDWSPNEIDLTSAYGLIGVVVGIIALAAVVGVKVLSSGVATSGMIVTGTAFLIIWGIFSVMAISGIQSIPVFGVPFYFVLTLIYAVGIFFTMGNSSGGE